METYHPPIGFHFKVQFEEIENSKEDHQFQSVSVSL